MASSLDGTIMTAKLSMNSGDLVQYINSSPVRNTGIAVYIYKKGENPFDRDIVEIMWDDGNIATHDVDEFTVISESR